MARVTLVEAMPWNPATGAAVPVRLAGGGRRHYRHKGHADWLAGVVGPPLVTAALDFDGAFTGGAIPSSGAIGFMPARRDARARLARLLWNGAPIVVSIGDDALPAPAWTVELAGRVAGYSVAQGMFTFTIASLAGRLGDPLVTATFTGKGGIEGSAQAAGRLKRRGWGRLWNVEGRLLDEAQGIWEFGDPGRPIQAFDAVKDKGRAGPMVLVPWAGSAEATLAALKAAAAPVGGCAAAPSIACVKWYTQATLLTADLRGEIGSGYVETVAGIAAAISAAAGGPVVSDLAIAVAARPDPAGIFVDEAGERGVEVLDRLLLRASMGWEITPAGPIAMAPIAFDAPVAEIVANSLEREAAYAPVTSVSVGWRRNHRRHTSAEISAAVLADDVVFGDGATVGQKIDEAGKTAEWDRVADPSGKKPDDNATNSGDPNSPFGGGTVGGTVKRLSDFDTAIAAAKKRTDALENDTIPAINAAVEDADTRIDATRTRADQALTNIGELNQRVDAIVAEGGYDDTDVRAKITQAAGVAANAAQAVGDLSTSVNARFGGVGETLANYDQRITTLTTGAESFASRSTALETSASYNSNSAVRNDNFNFWPEGQSYPSHWVAWSAQGNYRIERLSPGRAGGRYCVKTLNDVPNVDSGFFQRASIGGAGKWVADVTLTSVAGGLSGAGVTLDGGWNLDFCGEPDVSGRIGNSADGETRSWSKMFDLDGRAEINVHAMVGWSGFGRTITPKYSLWHRLALRPATDGEIKAGKADAALNNPGGVLARISANEATLADLPNRYAAVQQVVTMEAQLSGNQASGLSNFLGAHIEERATAIADAKAGAVAQTLATLRTEYNGTVATVSQQAGTIVDVNYRTRSYWRTLAVAGNSRAQMTVFADDNNGGGVDIIGNVSISGDLTIDGTVTARKFNGASMAREARAIWTGSITPTAGQSVTVPWGLALAQIPPIGRFIYEYSFTLSTNAGTSQFLGNDPQGRPRSIQYLDDGGMVVVARDGQGNDYAPRANSSDRVAATTDFVPNWAATISAGSTNYTENDGEYVITYRSASYTVTRIDLKVTWVAI